MKGKRSKSQTEPTGRGMGDVKLLRPKAVQGIGGKSPHPQDKVAGCSSLLGPVSTYLPPGARAFLETCLLPELCPPVPPRAGLFSGGRLPRAQSPAPPGARPLSVLLRPPWEPIFASWLLLSPPQPGVLGYGFRGQQRTPGISPHAGRHGCQGP